MEVAQSKFQRQLVSVCAQSGHHADGKVRKIRVMAEGFARVNVGKVDFDERDGGGGQCVAQRDAGMGVTRRIDENEVNLIARGLVHAINQGAFMIVLKDFDQSPGSAPAVDQSAVDVGERDEAIVRGLTTPQRELHCRKLAIESGVPVVSQPGLGYSLVEGYFLPPVSFSSDEATMLLREAGND